jgi:hypothetical protein
MAMHANMRATGRSHEEISAAMIQLFLNCPIASLDSECKPLDPDEHADNAVEQEARRDQQQLLAAMQAEKVADSPTIVVSVATEPPPTPLPPHDVLGNGGAADVGGVGDHQSQDTSTETSTAAGWLADPAIFAPAPLTISRTAWGRDRALESRERRRRQNDGRQERPPEETEDYISTSTSPLHPKKGKQIAGTGTSSDTGWYDISSSPLLARRWSRRSSYRIQYARRMKEGTRPLTTHRLRVRRATNQPREE